MGLSHSYHAVGDDGTWRLRVARKQAHGVAAVEHERLFFRHLRQVAHHQQELT